MGLKIIGEIALDGSGFERGLNRASHHVTDFVKNATVAAFGFYGVEEAVKKTVETASELVNTSKRLDVTVEQLQLLKQAAKDAGADMGALAGVFEKIDLARAKALSGDKGALAAFARLGVSPEALKTQTAATMFTGAISSAAKGSNVESLAPAFREVLGKGFGEIIPVLKTDFDELGDKMHKLGNLMDAETAVKLKLAGDEFELIGMTVIMRLAPALATLTDWMIQLGGKVKELVSLFGGLFSHGPKEGFLALNKAASQTIADVLPKSIGGVVNKLTDAQSKLLGADPKELQSIIDATGESVNETAKENMDELAKYRAKVEQITNELNNPKPIVPDVTGDSAGKVKSARMGSLPADALVKVGNFLGSNGNTIERANQQKIALLQRQAHTLDAIHMEMRMSKIGGFGIGIPLV